MTNREQQSLNEMHDLMREIRTENQAFKETILKRIESTEKKVKQKDLPLNLEKEVVYAATNVINDSMKKVLTDSYNSPLKKYAENVISKYKDSIENIFDSIVSNSIKTSEFKLAAKDALLNKITKTVISGIDGSVDKVIHQMKQDSVFRSKLTLMVNELIKEFSNKK